MNHSNDARRRGHRRRHRLRAGALGAAVALLLGCLLIAPTPSRAHLAPHWAPGQLVAFSSVVVKGRVLAIFPGRDPSTNAIYTFVRVGVDRAMKGLVPTPEIVIKQLGGRIGVESLDIGGQAEFEVGEEVLLFLEVRPRDLSLYTTAFWQGKWRVVKDPRTGKPIAVRKNFEGPDGKDVILLSPFAAELESWTGRGGLRSSAGNDYVLVPPDVPRELWSAEASRPDAGARARADSGGAGTKAGGPSYSFLTPSSPSRWFEPDDGVGVPVELDRNGQEGVPGGGETEARRAQSLWNGVSSAFRWVNGGLADGKCFSQEAPGRTNVAYGDPCNEISNSGSTLAIGGYSRDLNDTKKVNGTTFSRITSAGIVHNDNQNTIDFYSSNPQCFQDTQTHELGHALGLGHADDPGEIMYPYIDQDCKTAASSGSTMEKISGGLGPGDTAGLQFMHPTPPGAPSGLSASYSGGVLSMSWSAPSSGGTATSYVIQAGSSSGSSNLANFDTGSTSTSFSRKVKIAGKVFLRVRSKNSAGLSGPSNEESVGGSTGGCTSAPGAPTGLGSTVSGRSVTLDWSAPGSGDAPSSYVIRVGSAPGKSDLASFDTGKTATTFTKNDVPVRTYYVRVHAKNGCGTGPASAEIVVKVTG